RSATGIATTAGDPLETEISILDAVNSTNGSIQLQETDGILVVNLRQEAGSGSVSLMTGNGDITIANLNPGAVQAFSVGTITLDAQGENSNLTIQSQVQSVGGIVTLQAGNNVKIEDNGNVTSAGGNIFITAEEGT